MLNQKSFTVNVAGNLDIATITHPAADAVFMEALSLERSNSEELEINFVS